MIRELGTDGAELVGDELPPAQDHLQLLRWDRDHGLRTRSPLVVAAGEWFGAKPFAVRTRDILARPHRVAGRFEQEPPMLASWVHVWW